MTQDEVRDLIDKYIIKNSMGAITAVIMRPILEEILNQPNALIGNLEYLDTLEKTTIVDAINSIVNGQIVEINAKILELIEKDVEQDQRLSDIEIHDLAQDQRLDVIEQYDRDQDVKIEAIEVKNVQQDERLDLIDTHDEAQDLRIDLVEQHDRDQDGRLDSIENHDASQDVRMNAIELKNEEQDDQITSINLKDNAQDIQIADLQSNDSEQDTRLTNVEEKNTEQDTRLTDIEGVNSNQDIEIQSLKNKDISQDAEIQNLKDKDALQDAEITDLDNRVDTLENKVATVYIPKGSVADITALFALTNQGIGWVYNLEDTGMNYVWLGGNDGDQGNGWDSLGGWVDFSEYYTRLEVDSKLDGVELKNEEQDEKILLLETEVERLEVEKADKTEIPDVSGFATKTELTDSLELKANKLDVEADLLQLNTEIEQVETALSSKIGDAPSDGKQYARQDEAWSEVIAGGSGSLVKVDLEDGTVSYKLDSNDLVPTTPSIDLRAGNQTTNLGQYAVSISAELPEGAGNTASGDGSTVSGGAGNTASGDISTVSGGFNNTASGHNSTISGGNANTASGNNSTVSGGNSNTASGDISTVSGGFNNTASGLYSAVSGGLSNTTNYYSETVVGMFSDNTGMPESSRLEGSPIFRVGIGTSDSTRKDGFIVTNEGNVELPENGTGIILNSPNGSKFKITVGDDGALNTTAL